METSHQFETIDRLQRVLEHLKEKFVGKDDIIDLMGICLAGRENLFLLGPPGTAKSAMVRELSKLLNGKTFEYLLTRFTEPNELFGPFDIRKLREGDLVTNTEGMLPEANLIFLDELLNANSAILNSLLMVLNEKVFRRGRENRPLPAVMIVGASNHLPEDEALHALFDRFLVRVRCDYVDPALLNKVLDAGWNLEKPAMADQPEISAEDIFAVQAMIHSVDLQDIREPFINLIEMLRNAGVKVSDRRAVKLQRLIAASALLCKRTKAILSDMWVMRYIWDTEEQQEIIAGIINSVVEADVNSPQVHPRAADHTTPNAEEIYKEVKTMTEKWDDAGLALSERTIIKDRLRYLNGRSEWISNETQRAYVKQPIDSLWQKIIHSA
ncbi:AAA family ATPase [Terrimonas sp. NA20]|uniref:AAA family ATPase n=1 Tax=Terrimonas ginsenosidimutans TaxID=2908004 RepID=A0ABS9KJX9_9BACT|nr:AAA family ATPase [Terrimonas ginsenosidimutans]MCG2612635.1 AAA family ATPase [Terrimonas ginsenosidimutans]